MLELIIVVLLIMWALGQFGPWPSYREGGLLHILLVIILIVILLRVFRVVIP